MFSQHWMCENTPQIACPKVLSPQSYHALEFYRPPIIISLLRFVIGFRVARMLSNGSMLQLVDTRPYIYLLHLLFLNMRCHNEASNLVPVAHQIVSRQQKSSSLRVAFVMCGTYVFVWNDTGMHTFCTSRIVVDIWLRKSAVPVSFLTLDEIQTLSALR